MTSVRHNKRLYLDVLECKALGLNVRETAAKLNVSTKAVMTRLAYINKAMREELLSSLVYNIIPVEYASSLELNRIIVQRAMKMSETSKDERVCLEALRLAGQVSTESAKLLADSGSIGRAIQKSMLVIPRQSTNTPPAPPAPSTPPPSDNGGDSANSHDDRQQPALEMIDAGELDKENPQPLTAEEARTDRETPS